MSPIIVSGTVTESVFGDSLLAEITIDGYPGDPIWTDPATGFYSVTLYPGYDYTFHVTATNYVMQHRPVGPLTGDETQNFSLAPDFAEGCPADYNEIQIFHDGFEAGTLGPDWTTYIEYTGRIRVADTYPYSGAYGVLLDYQSDWWGTSAIILTQDLSNQDSVYLDFWWREFNDDNHDATWQQVFSFNDGPNAYRNDIVSISAQAAELGLTTHDHFQIKLQGYDWDDIPNQGYALDEIKLATCQIIDHGFLTGTVSDAYTGLPLPGAVVRSDSDRETTTDANGDYRLLDSPGSHTFTASDGGYQTISQTLTIIQNSALNHDFNLPWLGATPAIMAVADIDGDGDLDVAGNTASRDAIFWWENANADGSSWISHTVATGINNLVDVAVADIDRDGDMDVTAVSSSADSLFWWENANADGSSWTAYTMASNLNGAASVHTADIDQNGAIDLLVSATDDNDIIWYQNPLTVTREMEQSDDVTYITDTVYTPGNWVAHTVVNNFPGASVAVTIDFDDDGDLDILGGSTSGNQVIRLRNDGRGTSWYQYPAAWTVTGVTDITAADLDGDSVADVIAAANTNDDILAWINGGDGNSWTAQTVESEFTGILGVSSEDVDLDGDQDILAAGDDGVSWFENTSGNASAWTERILDETTSYAVRAADLDNDDDYDFVAASFASDTVTWWENESVHRINLFTGAYHTIYPPAQINLTDLVVGDIDGDGDQDFLTNENIYSDWLRWWENSDGVGKTWVMHEIATTYANFMALELGDIDNDGDTDAVGYSSSGGTPGDPAEIIFWENLDGSGGSWDEHVLPQDNWSDAEGWYDGPESMTLSDMNNDGQLDIVIGSESFVHWFELWTWHESDGTPVEWKSHLIAPSVDADNYRLYGIPSLEANDMDNDGDTDLVVAGYLELNNTNSGIVFWYENTAPCNGMTGILGSEYVAHTCRWIRHELRRNMSSSYILNTYETDVNRDGKVDVYARYNFWDNGGRCTQNNNIRPNFWKRCWSNNQWPYASTPGSGWWWPVPTADVYQRRTIDYTSTGLEVNVAVKVDLDNDGDGIFWQENVGGQFELPTTDASPTSMNAGTQDDVFQIEFTHLGWSTDVDIAWTTVELLLEDVTGADLLTTAEANAIIANLHLYLDDGDNTFDSGSDTLVHTETNLNLTDGMHTIILTDDDPNLTLSQATGSQTYFLVVELDGRLMYNAARNGVGDIRITHQTESSSQAEVVGGNAPLKMADTANTSAEIELLGATIDLSINKTVTPTVAVPGDTITYTLTYSNAGVNTAAGVVITDVIAAGRFSSLSYQSTGAAITEIGAISYTWQVENLSSNEGGVITIIGVLDESLGRGIYGNTAVITGTGEMVPGNNSSSVNFEFTCPASLVVDSLADGEDGEYCTGKNTLREAIANAGVGDTITFDAGLSGGAITLDGSHLLLTKDLNINANVPITVSGNNASRVFYINSGVAITLTNLTIRDGAGVSNGGGIYSLGELRLESITVMSNTVTTSGGGIYLREGSAVLSDTQVHSNTAVDDGGGIFVYDPGLTLNMVGGEVRNNTAQDSGGGIYLHESDAVLTDTLIVDNSASTHGGGFYFRRDNVRLTMNGGEIRGNAATTNGGGVYAYSGNALLSDTLIVDNSARSGGGTFFRGGAQLTIEGGQVRDNIAIQQGGGLYFGSGSQTLSGVQVHSNTAASGGGLYINNANALLTNSPVTSNSVSWRGGGLYVVSGSATLNAASVSGNTANNAGDAVYNNNGTISSASALTLTGEVYQAGGIFAASSYDLDLDGDLVLAGGDFYAPDAPNQFNLSGNFIHTGGNYHQTQVVTGNQNFGFPKAGGLILNANGLDLDSTAITITAGADCANVTPGEAVQHCYVISPTQTSGRDATITFFYQDTELLANHNCSAMEAFAWDNTWDNQLTRDTSYNGDGRLCGTDPQSIQVIDVSSFPTFTLRGMFADLEINKTVTPTIAIPGETVTYTLAFSNAGTITATDVVITDAVAVGQFSSLSYQSTGAAITETGAVSYTWQATDLAPEDGGLITLTGELNNPLALGTYTNTATISGEFEAATNNNSNSADLLVYCQPSLVVDSLADGDDGNYCAGENTLREAIANASAGDTVTFDAGLSGSAITLGGSQLELTKTLSIKANVPITVSGNNASRVFTVSNSTAVTLTGLTIRDGSATDYGGGIYSQGDLRLDSTDVISNSAGIDGGGLFILQGSVLLSGTQVISNSAGGGGGGLFIYEGSATLHATQVISNSASFGGGAYVRQPSAALNTVGGELRSNTASSQGGGLYMNNGAAVLSGTQVTGNSATSGGGLFLRGGNTTLNSTQILNNSVGWKGGGLLVDASATLNDVSVSGNSATHGGGMYVRNGSAILSGTSVDGSATQDGDAVYQEGSAITSASALTITGEVYQTGGVFAASSHDLNLDGDLALVGGDFYAPDAPQQFTLSGAFTHIGGDYHQTQSVTGNADFGFPKAGGLILNANGLDLDSTAVTLTAGTDCAGVTPGEAVQHCYVISPTQTSGRDATLTFFYRDSELLANHDCSVMEAYAWDGTWNNQLSRDPSYDGDGRLCGSEPQSIQVLNVSSFPTFTLRGDFVDLAISKAVTSTYSVSGEAAPGETITYTLTFTNNGPVTVDGVIITDTLPAEITVQSVISSGVAITRTLSNQTSEVLPGQGGIITITAQISSSFIALPVSFTNTAVITFSNAAAFVESDSANNSAAVGLTVPQFGLDNTASAGLPDINFGSVAWGDYDNDGDLDILLTGEDDSDSQNSVYYGQVYENTAVGFTTAYTMTGVIASSVDWGDYDNDGDLDFILSGRAAANNELTEVYENTGSGFSLAYTLIGVSYSSVDWGDYDNDGDLDILLSGDDNTGTPTAQVYENTGSGFNVAYTLTGVDYGTAAWGDYDNDGDLDILLTGWMDSGSYLAAVYQNSGSGFTQIESGLPGVDWSNAAWGDYDNDDDLDILLTGWLDDGIYDGPFTGVYRNNNGTANTQPAAPTGLSASVDGYQVDLSWTAATDPETISNTGLTYNLYAGNTIAENVVITDVLPAEITVQSVISSGDMAITRTLSNQTFEVFETSNVSPDQSGLITITAVLSNPLAAGTVTNTAVITTSTTEIVTANNSATVELTVNNSAPVLAPIGNQTITETETLTFTASASDANGDSLSYSLNNAPGTATIGSGTGLFTWVTTEADGPGVYTTTIIVSDGSIAVSETIRITVTEIPITGLSAISDSPTVWGSSTNFTATVTAGSSVVYDWDFGDGGGGSGGTTSRTEQRNCLNLHPDRDRYRWSECHRCRSYHRRRTRSVHRQDGQPDNGRSRRYNYLHPDLLQCGRRHSCGRGHHRYCAYQRNPQQP